MADGSKLPCDILHEIVRRFSTIEETIYFSVVCHSWNHFARTFNNNHGLNVKAMPWLLLAENTKDNPHYLRNVFNPYNNKCYQMKLPEISGCRCWGSEYGWVVTYRDSELHLFNPLTKERLSLPHRSCLPYKYVDVDYEESEEGGVEDSLSEEDSEEDSDEEDTTEEDSEDSEESVDEYLCFFKKAFVCEVAPNDYIVLVTYFGEGYKMGFTRPGDRLWTSIEYPRRMVKYDNSNRVVDIDFYFFEVVDVVVHDAKILILYGDLSVGYLDISDFSDPQKLTEIDFVEDPRYQCDEGSLYLKAKGYVPAYPAMLSGLNRGIQGLYLAHSCGDLFLVLKNRCESGDYHINLDKNDFDYRTTWFSVHRLESDTKMWSQVDDLGNVVLFLGNNSTMSVPAIETGKCESKCIYFTDDASNYWKIPGYGGKDMGVFKLGKSGVAHVYLGSDRCSHEQIPLWFTPQF